MEKGTLYLILDNLVLESFDFDKSMCFDNDLDIMKKLKKCQNDKDFINLVSTLNKENKENNKCLIYKNKPRVFFDKTEKDINLNSNKNFESIKRVIDFNNNYSRRFFVEWTFFKNLSDVPIKFITKNKFEENKEQIILNKGEGVKFKFGNLW